MCFIYVYMHISECLWSADSRIAAYCTYKGYLLSCLANESVSSNKSISSWKYYLLIEIWVAKSIS